MLHATIISNAARGLGRTFPPNPRVCYAYVPPEPGMGLDLSRTDVLIVPFGSGAAIAQALGEQVEAFIDGGGTLFCFDGSCISAVPGYRWVEDDKVKAGDVRYSVHTDRHGLLSGVCLSDFQSDHGAEGWWTSGYIEALPGADVLLEDTWERPVTMLDEPTANGCIFLTANGPLSTFGSAMPNPLEGNPFEGPPALGTLSGQAIEDGRTRLYQNLVNYVYRRKHSAARK